LRVHDYWRCPDDGINQPWRYRDVSPERSIYLVDLFKRMGIPEKAHVLELGCNCGRNLAHLWESGYRNLSGLEINPDAVKLLRETYPQLSDCPVLVSSLEDEVKMLPTRGYDVTYTMAVFCYIPRESDWVFPHVARTSEMIITVEDERLEEAIHFPRNYLRVFSNLGMEQVKAESCKRIKGLGANYYTRVFKHV
jgi:trans-aconitate methyltransferase